MELKCRDSVVMEWHKENEIKKVRIESCDVSVSYVFYLNSIVASDAGAFLFNVLRLQKKLCPWLNSFFLFSYQPVRPDRQAHISSTKVNVSGVFLKLTSPAERSLCVIRLGPIVHVAAWLFNIHL